MIEPKSSAIAGSCHSETAVHARLRARSTARSRRPLALMLSGLIVIGAIATPAAHAKKISPNLPDFSWCDGRKKIAIGSKMGYTSAELKSTDENYIKAAANALEVLERALIVAACMASPGG
ncbi:MAG TPA: hypothetical protein VII20_14375 [Roseiarcus sp.]|jgi:hypothetical protein